MPLTLPSLRTELESLLSEHETLRRLQAAGLPAPSTPAALLGSNAEWIGPEAFALATEESVRPTRDALSRRRLRALRAGLAALHEEQVAAAATEALARFEADTVVPFGEETVSFREAIPLRAAEPSRARRGVLERALGELLWTQRGHYARRLEAAQEAAEALGAPSYVALQEDLAGRPFAPLVAEAEALLAATEDAYRDLATYVLGRLEARLRPLPSGEARWDDLLHAGTAPHLAGLFGEKELLSTVWRWLGELGFNPDAGKRVRLDQEERTGKRDGPFLAAVQVPEELHLLLTPRAGLHQWTAALGAYARAQHLANVDAAAPLEDRRLGDAAVQESFARLFEQLLCDERWLRRYLSLSQPQARDIARWAAFQALTRLRAACVELPCALALHQRGATPTQADEFADRGQRALFVGVQRGFFLHDVGLDLGAATRLRGSALEVVLHRSVEGRFDQDWWRNPSAGRALAGLFARGQRDGAELLAEEHSGALTLTDAGARLLRILAA